MGGTELLHVAVLDAALAVVALGAGTRLLEFVDRSVPAAGVHAPREREPVAARLGASLLLGYGVVAYVGVGLGLLHAFHVATVAAALVAVAAVCRREIRMWLVCARRSARPAAFLTAHGPLTVIAAATSAALIILAIMVALAPPIANDALSYHLPQAHQIVTGHVLWLNLGGHPFYGSIPKLVEVLFAEAIALQGDALAQVVHVSVGAAFLLFAWGTVERFFGRRAAALTVLGILCYPEFTASATSAMIDAAVVSFEVAGVLAAASWAQAGRSADAARAALFIGLAAAAKYSALATLGLFALLAVVLTIRHGGPSQRMRNALLRLGGLALAASGFWYVKNLVKYGNPTYPLYFGHSGISTLQYDEIISDVQQFGPRTIVDFVNVPQRFANLTNLVAYASFFLGPLAVLVRRATSFTTVSLGYAAIYLPYWFFLASQQLRFLMPAVLVLIVLAATTLDRALERLTVRRLALGVPVGAAIAIPVASAHEPIGTAAKRVTQIEHARYGLGLQSRDDFLGRALGCEYRVLRWLDANAAGGNALDTWSVWHGPNVDYYAGRHHFVRVKQPSSRGRFPAALARANVDFYYADEVARAAWVGTTDPIERAWYRQNVRFDDWVDSHSRVVYRAGPCTLKRITAAREGAASGPLP